MYGIRLKIHIANTIIALIFWGLFVGQVVSIVVPLLANLAQISFVLYCVGGDLWRDIVNFFSKN